MTKETLLKAKERYEKKGDKVQLAKVEGNLKAYETNSKTNSKKKKGE